MPPNHLVVPAGREILQILKSHPLNFVAPTDLRAAKPLREMVDIISLDV